MSVSLIAPAEAQTRFNNLASTWRDETRLTSATDELIMSPSYQRIIGIGPTAVPLLLRELRDNPDHWFWALEAITGENPVAEDATFDEAVAAWLEWGTRQGLLN